MNTQDFSIGGRDFKVSKIDAMKQFHIVRRISPILSEMLPGMKGLKSIGSSQEEQLDQIAKFLTPIMTGMSKLSDEDSEVVLYGLLAAVEVRQAAGNWARVVSGRMLMMQDLDLPTLLQIAGRAFMFNLSGFFQGLPKAS